MTAIRLLQLNTHTVSCIGHRKHPAQYRREVMEGTLTLDILSHHELNTKLSVLYSQPTGAENNMQIDYVPMTRRATESLYHSSCTCINVVMIIWFCLCITECSLMLQHSDFMYRYIFITELISFMNNAARWPTWYNRLIRNTLTE